MRDLAGFAILVLVLVIGAFFTVEIILPFLVKYLLGLTVFFLAATWLVWKGRLHPIHLDSLLRPGYALAIGMLSWSVPAAHAMLVFLLTDVDHWLIVFLVNITFPVVWTSRLLVVHRRQKAIYVLDGHDIEDLLETARRRDAALEVKMDSLDSLAEMHDEPEPWELAVDVVPAHQDEYPVSLTDVRNRMADLRVSYGEIISLLGIALRETRSRMVVPPHPALDGSRADLERLEPAFERVMEESRDVMSHASSDTNAPGWED